MRNRHIYFYLFALFFLLLNLCGCAAQFSLSSQGGRDAVNHAGNYALMVDETTETQDDVTISKRVYTIDQNTVITAYRVAGYGEFSLTLPLEKNMELGRYDAKTADWTWAPAGNMTLSEKLITLDNENMAVILSCPLSFLQLENDSVQYLSTEDGYFTIDGKSVSITARLDDADFADFFVYTSSAAKLLREYDNAAKLIEREHRNANFFFLYSGYYGKAPANYEPSGDNVYYSCVASYMFRSFLSRISKCDECAHFALAFMDIESRIQGEYGYFPTASKSAWLAEAYGIQDGFYDTRFNTELIKNYLDSIELLGGNYYPGVIDRYLTFYTDYAADNHFETANGGWLVADYDYPREHILPHCSLNHQAAELLLLYKLADTLGREDLRTLGDKMLLGIEDCGSGFIRDDHNLHYAVYPDGHYGDKDYPYLTYNDLWELQTYLYAKTGRTNAVLQTLMENKKLWMDREKVTGYKTGGAWE